VQLPHPRGRELQRRHVARAARAEQQHIFPAHLHAQIFTQTLGDAIRVGVETVAAQLMRGSFKIA
jgi:hypothetical protein